MYNLGYSVVLHYYILDVIPIFDDKQTLIYMVGSLRDISEMKRSEAYLRNSEKLSVVGQMAAGVAHEIRNPITSISGYIQFWQKNNTPSPRSIATIYREVTRLNSIVDKLLQFVKPSQVNLAPSNLNQIIDKVSQFFKDTHHDDNITIVTIPKVGLPLAWIDFAQVEQVMMNIMYNAWQALKGKNGTITLRTAFNPDTDTMVLEVVDNGCGIPAENMSTLFDPFFTTRPKGTGLGLAIAYEIVRAHGGNIEVDSEECLGTSVKVYLPRAREE